MPVSAASRKRTRRRAFEKASAGMLLTMALLGCVSQYSDVPSRSDDFILGQFSKGEAQLTCSLACSMQHGFHRPEFKKLYMARDWRGLAIEVIAIGSMDDQSWYYLGVAAKEMGYRQAAITYFSHSVNISKRREPGDACDRLINNCDGFVFPRDSIAELNDLARADSPPSSPPTNRNVAEVAPSPAIPAAPAPHTFKVSPSVIPMQKQEGGTFAVPATINGQIKIAFMLDSGASDVSLPADVVLTLYRTGTITQDDFLGQQTYVMADGSQLPSVRFRIRSLRVGNKTVENVIGSLSPVAAVPLLGQSFLQRFTSWSIDNKRHALILGSVAVDDDQ
jgi:clan AA aspartic protease (TIGR02281 family)